MELLRVGAPGREQPVVRDGDRVFSLAGITADVDGAFLADDGLRRTRDALRDGVLPETDIAGLRIGAPLSRPSAVVCVGQNYAAHAAESGAEPPAEPIVFFKHPNTVVGPDDDVFIPPGATAVDWEVELGIEGLGRQRQRLCEAPRG